MFWLTAHFLNAAARFEELGVESSRQDPRARPVARVDVAAVHAIMPAMDSRNLQISEQS